MLESGGTKDHFRQVKVPGRYLKGIIFSTTCPTPVSNTITLSQVRLDIMKLQLFKGWWLKYYISDYSSCLISVGKKLYLMV